MQNIRLLCDSQCQLGEGPLWHEQEQAVYWVDIIEKQLHKVELDGSNHQLWQFESEISSINRREKGGFIATFREGFAFVDLPSGELTWLDSPEKTLKTNRYNDAKTDQNGDLWAGTMDDNQCEKTGKLYKLSADLHCNVMDENYIITNGPAFNLDGSVLYHNETAEVGRCIYRFDYQKGGALTNKEIFVQLSEADGHPDGMTVDKNGNLWLCHFAGKKVSKYSPLGERIAEYSMPVSNITSCTFVGNNLDYIVFTTARVGLSDAQLKSEPQAGGLFIAKTGELGVKVYAFSG